MTARAPAEVLDRLRAFLEWRGWSQLRLAEAVDHHQTYVGRVLHGERGVGLRFALAVERLTTEPREDGEVFPGGPIRATEWQAAEAAE